MPSKQLTTLKEKYLESIGMCEPIDYKGFQLMPLKMQHIYKYQMYKTALCIDSDNPFSNYPYMTMLYKLGEASGNHSLIIMLVNLLSMTLGLTEEERKRIDMFEDENGHIVIRLGDGRMITEAVFRRMRMLIALQNAIDIPDDVDNPHLRKYEQQFQAIQGNNYPRNIEHLIDGFCQHMRISRNNMRNEFTIYEFIGICNAVETNLMFNILHNGNYNFKDKKDPVPHWAYRLENDNPYGLEAVDGLNIAGEKAKPDLAQEYN